MSPTVIAFLFAISAATWVYSKAYRSTGGNNISAIIGSVVVFAAVFIVCYLLFNAVLPKSHV